MAEYPFPQVASDRVLHHITWSLDNSHESHRRAIFMPQPAPDACVCVSHALRTRDHGHHAARRPRRVAPVIRQLPPREASSIIIIIMSTLLTPLPPLVSSCALSAALDLAFSGPHASSSLLSSAVETASTLARVLKELFTAARAALDRLLNPTPKVTVYYACESADEDEDEDESEAENAIANELANELVDEAMSNAMDELVSEAVEDTVNELAHQIAEELAKEVMSNAVNEVVSEILNELVNEVANDAMNTIMDEAADEILEELTSEAAARNELSDEILDEAADEILDEISVQNAPAPPRNEMVAQYLCPCGECPPLEFIRASVIASGVQYGERASVVRVLRAFSTYNEVIGFRREMIQAAVTFLQEWNGYQDREDRALISLIEMYV